MQKESISSISCVVIRVRVLGPSLGCLTGLSPLGAAQTTTLARTAWTLDTGGERGKDQEFHIMCCWLTVSLFNRFVTNSL